MSSTDDLIEDDDAVELSDNELTSESHSTSVMTEELGIYSDLDHS